MSIPASFGPFWRKIAQGFVFAIFTTAWDMSAFVFYVFEVLIVDFHWNVLLLFVCYGVIVGVLCLPFVFCLKVPAGDSKTCSSLRNVISKLFNKTKEEYEELNEEEDQDKEKKKGFCLEQVEKYQLCMKSYFALCFDWKSVGLKYYLTFFGYMIWKSTSLWHSWYLTSTIYDQALWLSHNNHEKATRYANWFNVFLPIFSFVAVPFFVFSIALGFCLDKCLLGKIFSKIRGEKNQKSETDMGTITGGAAVQIIMWITYAVLSMIPVLEVQIAMYIFLIMARIFGFMYMYMANMELDSKNYSRNSGIILTMGGLLCGIPPLFMNDIVQRNMNGNYFWMNVVMVGIAGFGHVILFLVVIVRWVLPDPKGKKEKPTNGNPDQASYVEDVLVDE